MKTCTNHTREKWTRMKIVISFTCENKDEAKEETTDENDETISYVKLQCV